MRRICRTRFGITTSLALLALSVGGLALAGDITPPPGAVAPTGKTLSEIEPRMALSAASSSISDPGSYYLLNDVGRINISANNVSLDLNGFTVSNPGGNGINVTTQIDGLHIRNGFVTGCDGVGIEAKLATGVIVEDITASGNTEEGIKIGQGIVRRCVANANNHGIMALDGVTFGQGTVFIDCTAYGNTLMGFFAPNGGIEIRSCSSYENGDSGFFVNTGRFDDCVAQGNGADGFNMNLASASSCHASENAGDGFSCSRSRVFDCHAIENTGHGFYGDVDNSFVSCHSDNNDGDEYQLSGQRNQLRNNDAAGTGNIVVLDVKNVVIGNTAGSYSIVAGNLAGPIIDSGTIATNTNPGANYDY